MLTILALLFALPCLALLASRAVHTARPCPALPVLPIERHRAMAVARERILALTGRLDDSIETRMRARLADDLDRARERATLRARLAPKPLSLKVRIRKAIGWWHATSPVVRAIARPIRLARYHARTIGAAGLLALALMGSACSLARNLGSVDEARKAIGMGAASSQGKVLR